MASELETTSAHQGIMDRLNIAKRESSEGVEYWLARDIHAILGYPVWDKFVPVIDRARESFEASGTESSHHIAQTSKLMGVAQGATRSGIDFFLSRGACYLIAMNGDPSKPEIAAAQSYFAVQTRIAEIAESVDGDQKRLAMRERVTIASKRVSDAAKYAGVTRYALFHNARYRGLYNADKREVDKIKGLSSDENLLDRAGSLELSAHDFQMQLAATKIINEGINGERQAIDANLSVAKQVRQTIRDQAGVNLEDVPLEREPIGVVKKRVRQQRFLPKG